MDRRIIFCCGLLTVIFLFAMTCSTTHAAPQQNFWNQYDDEDQQVLMNLFSRRNSPYWHDPALDNVKRGLDLDLGLNRGFSGSQSAKHLMGLAAANYAGGPGRRRRSEQA